MRRGVARLPDGTVINAELLLEDGWQDKVAEMKAARAPTILQLFVTPSDSLEVCVSALSIGGEELARVVAPKAANLAHLQKELESATQLNRLKLLFNGTVLEDQDARLQVLFGLPEPEPVAGARASCRRERPF